MMDYMKVMSILGSIAMSHPSVVAMASQLINIWKSHQGEIIKINEEYLRAAQTATGDLDQAGIILQIMKLHPDIVPLIVQILSIIYPHIPETQQTLTQVQFQVMSS